MPSQVDHAEIKTGQLLTMLIAATAFFMQDPRILIGLGAIFLITSTVRSLSPFVLTYRFLVKPLNLMKSDYRLDNIQAHSFGQFVGAITAAIAVALLMQGYDLAGWIVTGVLIGLTFISYAGWCIGCFMYYQINRMGIRGFFKHSPTDKSVFTGKRPTKQFSLPTPPRAPR